MVRLILTLARIHQTSHLISALALHLSDKPIVRKCTNVSFYSLVHVSALMVNILCLYMCKCTNVFVCECVVFMSTSF